jgi:two-component system nitrogen regulation response regulator GlnG
MEDVAELAHFFLFRFDRELNLDLRAFAPETLELLQNYRWPGNVRELQGVVKQAMLNASGHVVLPEFLPEHLLGAPAPPPAAAAAEPFDLASQIDAGLVDHRGRLYDETHAAVDRLLLPRVLRETHGNQTEASELLGLSRVTLRHKLRTLGLTVERAVVPEAPAGGDAKPGGRG